MRACLQPDFDAVALPPCRLLRMRRGAYRAALEATSLDPVLGYQVRLEGGISCHPPLVPHKNVSCAAEQRVKGHWRQAEGHPKMPFGQRPALLAFA